MAIGSNGRYEINEILLHEYEEQELIYCNLCGRRSHRRGSERRGRGWIGRCCQAEVPHD